jgi:hypothetical protein
MGIFSNGKGKPNKRPSASQRWGILGDTMEYKANTKRAHDKHTLWSGSEEQKNATKNSKKKGWW